MNLFLSALLCSLLINSLASPEIQCSHPVTDLEEEYCNTLQLIQLYNRKLKILQEALHYNLSASRQVLAIPSPYPSQPNLYLYNTLFSGQTIFIPQDRVLNKQALRSIDGKLIATFQVQGVLATDDNQITTYHQSKVEKITFKPKGKNFSRDESYGMSLQGIKGLYIGKSPRVLLQYRQNELWINTKAGVYKNYSFDKNILSVSKGINNQAIYITGDEYGVISILDQNPRSQRLLLDSVLNGTTDRGLYVYLLTEEGKLITIDLKTHAEIGTSVMFNPNSIKTDLSVCESKLIIHRQTEPYVLIYNTTQKSNMTLLENITVCKQGNHTKFRYQTSCSPNTLSLLCGSGEGDLSQWKYGRYTFRMNSSTPFNSKYLYPGIIALTLIGFFVFKYGSKKRVSKERVRENQEQEEEMMEKIGGDIRSKALISRSKKTN